MVTGQQRRRKSAERKPVRICRCCVLESDSVQHITDHHSEAHNLFKFHLTCRNRGAFLHVISNSQPQSRSKAMPRALQGLTRFRGQQLIVNLIAWVTEMMRLLAGLRICWPRNTPQTELSTFYGRYSYHCPIPEVFAVRASGFQVAIPDANQATT
jgi:hypothetical protein